jgi:hypothetical protein
MHETADLLIQHASAIRSCIQRSTVCFVFSSDTLLRKLYTLKTILQTLQLELPFVLTRLTKQHVVVTHFYSETTYKLTDVYIATHSQYWSPVEKKMTELECATWIIGKRQTNVISFPDLELLVYIIKTKTVSWCD